MSSPSKAELETYLGKLPDGVQIIVVTSKDQIPAILCKHAETLTVGQKVFKYIRNIGGAIIAIWIFALTMFPEITPTPIQAYKIVQNNIPDVINHIDFSFPYPVPDENKPWVLIAGHLPNGQKMPEANYYFSGSGISPNSSFT